MKTATFDGKGNLITSDSEDYDFMRRGQETVNTFAAFFDDIITMEYRDTGNDRWKLTKSTGEILEIETHMQPVDRQSWLDVKIKKVKPVSEKSATEKLNELMAQNPELAETLLKIADKE